MYNTTRRQFLSRSVQAIGVAMLAQYIPAAAIDRKLSFSTLGCPDWTFDKIISFAAS